jgi:alkylation response protein AidB-like acyl-CoA dehydrogenase
MDLPGIEIRPITEITGGHTFNEVFFTDVRIPAENLVGSLNDGWRLAKVTLGNERVSLSTGGVLWGNGPDGARGSSTAIRDTGGVTDPHMRQRIASVYIEHTLLDLIRMRTLTAALKGEQPGPEASIRKILADEHGQHVMSLARDYIGAHGMLTGGDGSEVSCPAPTRRASGPRSPTAA